MIDMSKQRRVMHWVVHIKPLLRIREMVTVVCVSVSGVLHTLSSRWQIQVGCDLMSLDVFKL